MNFKESKSHIIKKLADIATGYMDSIPMNDVKAEEYALRLGYFDAIKDVIQMQEPDAEVKEGGN